MSFPRNSAFNPAPGRIEIGSLTPPPTVGSTKRLDVTEVPYEVLEGWYRDLDELLSGYGGLRRASYAEVSDRLEELRAQLYSYLR